jgi:hypothetical protein
MLIEKQLAQYLVPSKHRRGDVRRGRQLGGRKVHRSTIDRSGPAGSVRSAAPFCTHLYAAIGIAAHTPEVGRTTGDARCLGNWQ